MKLLTSLKCLSLALVVFSACSNNSNNANSTSDSVETIKSDDSVVVAAETAVFKDEIGNQIDLSSLKGKVHFINFWATWCPPCREEMPSIQVLYDKFKDDKNINFHIVEIEGDVNGTKAFLKDNNLNLPIVYPGGDIPSTWLGESIPATVILDKNGNIAMKKEGMHDYSDPEMIQFIQDLINK